MPQDVGDLVPRVRRAIEGPKPLALNDAGRLNDAQIEAAAADAIAEIILLTVGRWGHTLAALGTDPETWEVDPTLTIEEESLVAAQAALGYFFHDFKGRKISERIKNEGQEWEWSTSARLLQDQMKLLIDQRDAALNSLLQESPVLARYASFLTVRDQLAARVLEPYVQGLVTLG